MKVTLPCQLLVVLLTQSLAILCDSSFTEVHYDAIIWWLKNFTCVRDFLYRNISETSDEQTLNFLNQSGYVISCNLIGSELNQNIDLTAKGLSSTEMSNRETSKQIAVECFGWNVP